MNNNNINMHNRDSDMDDYYSVDEEVETPKQVSFQTMLVAL